MVKHIVMWKLKEMTPEQKAVIMEKIKTELEALNGQIDGLVSLEVGIDFLQAESSYDLVLLSVLTSKEALATYQAHPLHQRVAVHVVQPVVSSRLAVDYEC